MARRVWRSPGAWALGLGVLLLAGAACMPRTGAYPVDIFYEMHYQQSYRPQEPPRLAPPEGAVPITGREPLRRQEEYRALRNPLPRTEEGLRRAREVFRVNCSICHGAGGKGDGPVAEFLVRDGYARPPDLTISPTRDRTDGEIFGLISEGVFVMPRFKDLLPEGDRWLLVHYIRTLQGE